MKDHHQKQRMVWLVKSKKRPGPWTLAAKIPKALRGNASQPAGRK